MYEYSWRYLDRNSKIMKNLSHIIRPGSEPNTCNSLPPHYLSDWFYSLRDLISLKSKINLVRTPDGAYYVWGTKPSWLMSFSKPFAAYCENHTKHTKTLCWRKAEFQLQQVVNIVAYRPAAEEWLHKQRPFLGNGSVNTFPLLGSRFLTMQQLEATTKGLFFLCGPWRDVISKGRTYLRVQFCTGGCEDRSWKHEAEESTLLEAVARERLVKTQHALKGSAGAVVICELWRCNCL
jgi:hypothetical protein